MSLRLQSFTRVPAIGLQTILFSSILAACGGGSSSGDSTTATPVSASQGSGSTSSSSSSDGAGTTTTSTGDAGSVVATGTDSGTTTTTDTGTGTVATGTTSTDTGTATAPATDTVAASTDTSSAVIAAVSYNEALVPATETSASAQSVKTNASASGYFVDTVAGNDSNVGSQAAPFKTLARLTSLKLTSGQGIYLHCGQVWRESLTLNSKQLVDGSTLSSYGSNCATTPARITGSNDFSTGWTAGSNGVWSRPVPAGTPKITRLFINGAALRTAQWPNYAPGNEGATPSSSQYSSNWVITPAAADMTTLAGKDVTGATALLHSAPWQVETNTVASMNTTVGSLTMASATTYPMVNTSVYALTDKRWMLDAQGEFFHDTTNNMLYMIPYSGQVSTINSSLIEGAVRDLGAMVSGRGSLAVSQIQFDMTRLVGLDVDNALNAHLSSLVISHNAGDGMKVTGVAATGTNRNPTLDSSTLQDNAVMAIDSQTNRVTVSNSWVSDTGTLGWSGATLAAVSLGDGSVAYNNTVRRSGYIAIRFGGGDNSNISSNQITDYCTRLPDCGAIYTWFGQGTVSPYAQVSTVANNRISGSVIGNGSLLVAGIYLDDFSHGSTVSGNTVVGGGYGIYVHNGSKHTITNNQLWLNQIANLLMGESITTSDAMTGNTITGNQFAPASTVKGTYPTLPQFTTSYAVKYTVVTPDLSDITSGVNKFQSNTVINLQGASEALYMTRVADGTTQTLTTAGWKVYAPNDGAIVSPAKYSLISSTTGAELATNGTFSAGLQNWGSIFAGVGGALTEATATGCTGPCAEFTATSVNDSLASKAFSLTANSMYVVRYVNVFTAPTMIAQPYIAMSAAPYSNLSSSDGMTLINSMWGTTNDTVNVEAYFHASNTATGVAALKVRTAGVPVYIDNVSVKNVTGYQTSVPASWAVPAIAATGSSATFNCASLGWDAGCSAMDTNGNAISLPVTIPAGTAQLILRADSSWRQ